MTEGTDMIENVARVGMALCQNALGSKQCPCAEKGVFKCADAYPGYQAKAAIAAMTAQAEPVAWMYERGDVQHVFAMRKGNINGIPVECWTETPLYASPAEWRQ